MEDKDTSHKYVGLLSRPACSIIDKNSSTRCLACWRCGPRLISEHTPISRFYFGPDIRDVASPDFIGWRFCVKTYPFRDASKNVVIEDNCVMDTMTRLEGLVGKEGLRHTNGGDFRFTFISTHTPKNLTLFGADEEEQFQKAVSSTDFTVRFADGLMVDGSNTKLVSGFYISKIFE